MAPREPGKAALGILHENVDGASGEVAYSFGGFAPAPAHDVESEPLGEDDLQVQDLLDLPGDGRATASSTLPFPGDDPAGQFFQPHPNQAFLQSGPGNGGQTGAGGAGADGDAGCSLKDLCVIL